MPQGTQSSGKHKVGQHACRQANPHGTKHEGTTDEAPRSAHQPHGVDDEAARIDREADGVVDEHQRNQKQQSRHRQQHIGDFAKVAVQAVDQVFLIDDVGHEFVAFQAFAYPKQTVGAGVICHKVELERRRVGILTEELRGVLSHGFGLLLQGLCAADEGDVLDPLALFQLLLVGNGGGVGGIVVHHHSDGQTLPYALAEPMGGQCAQYHQSHQNEHKCSADGACQCLPLQVYLLSFTRHCISIQNSKFKVQNSKFKAQNSKFKIQSSSCIIYSSPLGEVRWGFSR